MMDRQHGKIVLQCDSCEDTEESERGQDWAEFWEIKRKAGWKAERCGSEWTHTCAECRRNGNEA